MAPLEILFLSQTKRHSMISSCCLVARSDALELKSRSAPTNCEGKKYVGDIHPMTVMGSAGNR